MNGIALKPYFSLKIDRFRAHQYIVEVPGDLAQSLSATVSISGWDQQINVVQFHLSGMKFAWAFVPAGNPIEECYSELYAQLDTDQSSGAPGGAGGPQKIAVHQQLRGIGGA